MKLLFAPATDSPWLSPAPSTKPKRGPHPHPAGGPSGGTLLLRFAPSVVWPAGESFRDTLTHPFLTCGSSGISSPVLRSGHSLAGSFGPAHSFPTLRLFPGHDMNNRLRSGEHTLPHSGPPAAVLLASLWCSSSVRSSFVGYHLLRSGQSTDPGPLGRLLCSRSGPAPWRRGSSPRLTNGMSR